MAKRLVAAFLLWMSSSIPLYAASPDASSQNTMSSLRPQFKGLDQGRKHIQIRLEVVVTGLNEPTDLVFLPKSSHEGLIAEKSGALKIFDFHQRTLRTLHILDVLTLSEQGLLGIALHPDYSRNGKLYLNYSIRVKRSNVSRVSEWKLTPPHDMKKARLSDERILLEVEQPYPNHNAGDLAFGPDGMLYIAWGDGGWRADPKGHGQNGRTLLGSVLRIDVNRQDPGVAYGIPQDNPFLKHADYLPEIWAIGFRNPWRVSFSPQGWLIVADVGQDRLEEIDIVEKGKNYGWNIREASSCFEPPQHCSRAGLTDPIYEYPREDGRSITGGYVYQGKIQSLQGKYVFGDFASGRIWALTLPERPTTQVTEVQALGKWPITISTFGQDDNGEIYVADFSDGVLYRILSN